MEFQQFEFAVIAPQSWPDMPNSEDLEQFDLCVTVRPFRTVFFPFSGCVQLWQVSVNNLVEARFAEKSTNSIFFSGNSIKTCVEI